MKRAIVPEEEGRKRRRTKVPYDKGYSFKEGKSEEKNFRDKRRTETPILEANVDDEQYFRRTDLAPSGPFKKTKREEDMESRKRKSRADWGGLLESIIRGDMFTNRSYRSKRERGRSNLKEKSR